MARQRARWCTHQGRLDPRRLIFIDETWVKTNLTRTHGRCAVGQRLVAKVPHGHVWTPLPVQEVSAGRMLRVIGCGHVSGLWCGTEVWPRARMGCEDQVHITGTRSWRSPCAWFS